MQKSAAVPAEAIWAVPEMKLRGSVLRIEESDAASALCHEEQELMKEWQERWQEKHSQYRSFNADGIVEHDRWRGIPEGKHVLVILKETNGLDGSLARFLRDGGNDTYYRTWNNVARWVKMIFDHEFADHVSRNMLNDMVRNIAAVNLKKYAGGARADNRVVKAEAMLDADLLQRQIVLYQPNIILTGGWGLVSDFVHDNIFRDDSIWYDPRKREDKENEPNLWYYRTDKIQKGKGTLVISMPHPNRASKKWTLELGKVLEREEK